MPRVVHDLPVRLGMSLEEARAALDGAGVAFDVREYGDGISSTAWISVVRDGIEGSIEVDTMYGDSVQSISTTEEVRDLEAGVALVRRHIERHGPPVELRLMTGVANRHVALEWLWEDFEVSVSRGHDEPWRARVASAWKVGPSGASTITFAQARATAAEARASLDAVRPAEGERGAAIARWAEILGWRSIALDRFLDVAAETAPRAPVSAVTGRWLSEHSRWLARHEDLFDQPDDWRDALVVSTRARVDHIEAPALGWTVRHAREYERGREVHLIIGPFASGVHRVLRPVEERYPLRGDLRIEQVVITPLPKEESLKWTPDRVEASSGEVTLRLAGSPSELERMARLLAAARAVLLQG